jgi:peptidyl-prolyl cis-trans isomerase B (cyclophilin B)
MKKWVAVITASVASTLVFAGPVVEMKTNMGMITIELDDKAAPKHVENFVEYVKSGHYDGTVFHRVISGFMAQGGGYGKDMKEKRGSRAPVRNEGEAAEKAGLKNDRGTISAARTGDPHSATAQFYINFKDNTSLNHSFNQTRVPPQCKEANAPQQCAMMGWGYTAFGRVTSGMDIVDKMATIPTGAGGQFPTDVPKEQIVIEKVTLKK